MKTNPQISRLAIPLLCAGLILGICGPIDFTPSAEAATSAEKRKTRKLKRDKRKLKKEVQMLRFDLATALTPPPTPGMKLIPAGVFQMGDADDGATGGGVNELPLHFVSLSAFYIDQFEVSKALWDAVAAWGVSNGYSDLPIGEGQGAFHPVQSVSWYAVVKWCNARSEMEGMTPVYYTDATQTVVYRTGNIILGETFVKWKAIGFRLPTEAEWEKAARGGLVGNTYPWGNAIGGGDANFTGSGDPFDGVSPDTTPVGFYDGGQLPAGVSRANGYGLYDVAGNVYEWCWDRYGEDYYGPPAPPSIDPRGPSTGGFRIARGNSWAAASNKLRCARRFFATPVSDSSSIGFRSARGL